MVADQLPGSATPATLAGLVNGLTLAMARSLGFPVEHARTLWLRHPRCASVTRCGPPRICSKTATRSRADMPLLVQPIVFLSTPNARA
jgi:hypothetical protein